MIRSLKKALFALLICALTIGLMQTAAASGNTLVTTTGVNLRGAASTNAAIVRTVGQGVSVEVLTHDPAGWSRVRVSGSTGFIRSDFLALPSDASGVTFRTTEGVNFRAGPSTSSRIIRAYGTGTNVEMLTHNPAGWSKVKINDTEGYIRSDFLALRIDESQQSSGSTSSAGSGVVLRTSGNVNFRVGPSTDTRVIRVLSIGTPVEIIEQNQNGWSKVLVGGAEGYIRSDLLREGDNNVELLDWSVARNVIRTGVPMQVVDVRTGLNFTLRTFSMSGHADVEPMTQADTDVILQTRNGVWSWDARPVWVTINGRTLAASINGMPHDVSTISDNGIDGHFCLHFAGTVTNNKSYQADLRNAVAEAWNAAQR